MIESAQSALAELESLFDEDIDKARKMDLGEFYEALKQQSTPAEIVSSTIPDDKA